MKNQTEMKGNVLQNLIDLMMGSTGSKIKPKMVSIEVVKPAGGKDGLEEVLNKASEEAPEDEEMEEVPEDEEVDKKRSLKDFFARK